MQVALLLDWLRRLQQVSTRAIVSAVYLGNRSERNGQYSRRRELDRHISVQFNAYIERKRTRCFGGHRCCVGVVLSTSIVNHSTEASVGGKLTVGGLTVTSNGTSTPVANSAAVAGGLLAAGVNLATSQATPTVKASIGDDSIIVVKRDAIVSSVADVTGTDDVVRP